MDVSKIRLSPSEKELVSNAEIILTKNNIIKKAISLLEWVQEEILDASKNYRQDIMQIPPKISRGENYEGLPYAILDFPRISGKDGFLFIRSMFWWGNFFSSTLHVSGIYKSRAARNGKEIYENLRDDGYFICISDDAWLHHFQPDNYKPIVEIDAAEFSQLLMGRPFIKIAAKFPVEDWETAAMKLSISWNRLISLITQPVK